MPIMTSRFPKEVVSRIMDYADPVGVSYTTDDLSSTRCGVYLADEWKRALMRNVICGGTELERFIEDHGRNVPHHPASYFICMLESTDTRITLCGTRDNPQSAAHLFINDEDVFSRSYVNKYSQRVVLIESKGQIDCNTGVSLIHFPFYAQVCLHDINAMLDRKIVIKKMDEDIHHNLIITLINMNDHDVEININEPVAVYRFTDAVRRLPPDVHYIPHVRDTDLVIPNPILINGDMNMRMRDKIYRILKCSLVTRSKPLARREDMDLRLAIMKRYTSSSSGLPGVYTGKLPHDFSTSL